MELEELDAAEDVGRYDDSPRYRVEGWSAVAVRYVGRETERYWDLDEGIDWDEPAERETGNAVIVMVGDDRRHAVDPSDLVRIDSEDYCGGCGQIGCGWG